MHRPRRLRRNPIVREMIAETRLTKDMFIYPYFVVPGQGVTHAIEAMPGINHFSTDTLLKDVEKGLKLGVNKVMLFGVGDEKSEDAHAAYDPHALVPTTVKELKRHFGADLYVVTDVCVCSYTTHGHCGIMANDEVANDASVDLIAKMALNHAQAGADMLAPSDIMDGRIAAIRAKLDGAGQE
ncbi:MAG: porphobilinogen synthase, partial [Pedobacter sp.]|nr:porphobilinogen synthase [Pedobacter sp.]